MNWVIGAVVLFFSSLGFAQTAGAIVRKTVVVEGTNDEWTPTTLKLEKGDVIVLLASGEVKVGDWIGKTSAAGSVSENQRGKVIREGTLVIKAGSSAAKPVGERKWFAGSSDFGGSVKIKVHDTGYGNNSGSYSVDTFVVPAVAVPAAIDVTTGDKVEVPAAPIVRIQATVEGTNDEWTSTGLKLEKGDVVLVEATGEVNGAKPSGRTDSATLGSPYCLTFKVGTGAAQYLGDFATLIANEPGLLKLRVNSKEFSENKGKFIATIMLVRASALPAAEVVKAE